MSGENGLCIGENGRLCKMVFFASKEKKEEKDDR